ncbi:MAG TPA: hypothetical protein VLX92_31995 [Kofleriaceae bacterium]|nr:hypothetical protein [Kofleriaceae bacterium]
MNRGEIIVLGLDAHDVIAAACLTTTGGRGHLAFLVVDPAVPELDERIRGVAGGLSEADRCEPSFAPSFHRAS